MMAYWPWWLGALALAGITIGFWLLLGRSLGISGSFGHVVGWRQARSLAIAEAPFRANPRAMDDALLAETLAEFGQAPGIASHVPNVARPHTPNPPARAPWTVHVTFLLALMLGGLIAAWSSGQFALRLDLGATHQSLFGSGWTAWLVLAVGGGLVGFGTQMAGGCTSGHGLSGCSRLVPASLLATGAFFGMAVLVSLFLEVVSR